MGHHYRDLAGWGEEEESPPPSGTPEINVTGNGNSISNGDATPSATDHTDFGSSPVGTPISRTFTIENTGDGSLTGVNVSVPSGFTLTSAPSATIAASDSSTFTVRADAASKATFSGNISIASNDSNENPYTFAITMTAIQAEMNVKGNGVSIADGDATPSSGDHTDFGSTQVGTTVTRTFTIENTGDDTLTITTPITVPSGFTCTSQPATSVAAGGSTTFQVRADASAVQTYSGDISIASSDADENPYNFSISVTVTILTDNLVSWYDASDAATLFEDSGGSTPAADNADVIGRWADKSGNGYHLTQATTGNKPTLRTNIQNGKSGIRGDGTDDILSNTSYPDFGDTYTVYWVLKNNSAGDAQQINFYVTNGAVITGFGGYIDSNNSQVLFRDASSSRTLSKGDLRDNTTRIHRMTNTGSQGQYGLNDAAVTTVAYTAPNPNTLNRLEVFGTGTIANYFQHGDLFEILIYSATHDATQQANMVAYLNAKWACF
jgi:hypothetical protein